MNLEWMAWTPYTAGIFIAIGVLLACMTVWEIVSPTVARRGLLPLETTRGDRFFVGMLGSAYIVVAWIGVTDLTLWYALVLAAVFLGLTLRYG